MILRQLELLINQNLVNQDKKNRNLVCQTCFNLVVTSYPSLVELINYKEFV